MTSNELRKIYSSLGFTQVQMAEALGVSTVSFKRFATGERVIPSYVSRLAIAIQLLYQRDLFKLYLSRSKSEPAASRAPRPVTELQKLARVAKARTTLAAKLLAEGRAKRGAP